MSDSVKTFSCSASQGAFAPAHNKRIPSAMKGKENYDSSLSHKNVILLDRNIKDVYGELFEKEYQKHISKLKNGAVTGVKEAKTARDMKKLIPYVYSPDEEYKRLVFTRSRARKSEYRQVYEGAETYLDYLRKSGSKSKGNFVVEEVLQIGNGADHLSEKEAIQAYTRTLELIRERFGSNLALVQAVIHFDETGDLSRNEEVRGTPHLHISFVPYFSSKSGMPLQYGFGEARKQLGFTAEKSGIDTYESFHEALRDIQAEALREMGYDRHIVGDTSRHRNPEIYRRERRNEEARIREEMQEYRKEQKAEIDRQMADYQEEKELDIALDLAGYEADQRSAIGQELEKEQKKTAELEAANTKISDEIDRKQKISGSLSEQISGQKKELKSVQEEFDSFCKEATDLIEAGMVETASRLPSRTSFSSLMKGLDDAVYLFEKSPVNVKGDLLVDRERATIAAAKLKVLKSILKPLAKAVDFIREKGRNLFSKRANKDIGK